MAKKYYPDDELKNYPVKDFKLGYNSYAASKSLIKDNEFPYGVNVLLDDNGSVTKRNGSSRYGGEVLSGKAPKNGVQYRTTTVNELIVGVGTKWKKSTGSSFTDIPGLTFTDDLDWDFVVTLGRLYGCNGTDKLAYYDGSTITEQTTNGNVGDQVVAFNARLYMTNSSYPDRIYYSNPYSYDAATAAFSVSNFGTFNTDLTSTPKKNAGYIMLDPGSGVRITKLKVYSSVGTGDCLYVWTNRQLWKITPVAEPLDDGSIAHSISVIVDGKGTPAPKSVVQMGNDLKFFDYDNIYSLGEQPQYQNIRVSTLSGRIKSEIDEVTIAGKSQVAMGFFKDKLWFSYRKGTYNDRICIYDVRLNAWGAPFQGLNIGWFLDFEETDGTHRWLGGSSDSADSYVYELDTGTNDNSTAVSAEFETKSFDCGKPGLIKRFAFIDVFYALLFGKLSYQVFIDEVDSTGIETIGLGTSSSVPSGCGTQPVGTFPFGLEYNTATTFATLLKNSTFRIELGYVAGKRISVRFTNNNLGEQFKINSMIPYFIEGSIHEQ